MNKLIKNSGIIVGLVIVLLSVVVFTYNVDIKPAKWADIKYTSVEAPEYEDDKYYGGDAYSGIQNAAAQAANNAIAVYDEVKQGNEAVKTMNENLNAQAEADADNLESIAGLIKVCVGSILLSIGLLTIAKNIAPLKKEKDFARSIGKDVELKLYKAINKEKEFVGVLAEYDEETVTLEMDDASFMTFDRSDIAIIRLAVFF